MATQGMGHGFGLGVTEFGELSCRIDDRAVVLAELVLSGRERTRLRCEASSVETIDNGIDGPAT